MLLSFVCCSLCADYYDLLGLAHNCTERDVERAFVRLSRQHHPDKNRGNATSAALYHRISTAYSALRDPARRRVYDLWGARGVEIFESGDQARDAQTALVFRRGATQRLRYRASLLDVHEGAVREIAVRRAAMCRCPERGHACAACGGRATVREDAVLRLPIERGLPDGAVVAFRGAGDASEFFAPGDIEVVVSCAESGAFSRRGDDVHMRLDVSVGEALLGIQREIENFDGERLRVDFRPECSRDSHRVPGKGLRRYLSPGERGDLVIDVNVQWEKVDDTEKKRLLNFFNETKNN